MVVLRAEHDVHRDEVLQGQHGGVPPVPRPLRPRFRPGGARLGALRVPVTVASEKVSHRRGPEEDVAVRDLAEVHLQGLVEDPFVFGGPVIADPVAVEPVTGVEDHVIPLLRSFEGIFVFIKSIHVEAGGHRQNSNHPLDSAGSNADQRAPALATHGAMPLPGEAVPHEEDRRGMFPTEDLPDTRDVLVPVVRGKHLVGLQVDPPTPTGRTRSGCRDCP